MLESLMLSMQGTLGTTHAGTATLGDTFCVQGLGCKEWRPRRRTRPGLESCEVHRASRRGPLERPAIPLTQVTPGGLG